MKVCYFTTNAEPTTYQHHKDFLEFTLSTQLQDNPASLYWSDVVIYGALSSTHLVTHTLACDWFPWCWNSPFSKHTFLVHIFINT